MSRGDRLSRGADPWLSALVVDRRRRGRHVRRVAGPHAAGRPTTCRSWPSSAATSPPTPPAASRTGSAGWSTTATTLVARTPERVPQRRRHRRAHPARGGRHRPRPARGGRAWRSTRAGARSASRFDQLVYATGAVPVHPPLGAHRRPAASSACRPSTTATPLHAWLDRDPKPRARGGGRRRLHRRRDGRGDGQPRAVGDPGRAGGPQPMSTVDPDMGALVARGDPRRWASTCAPARAVTGLEPQDGRVSAVVTDDGTIPADIVVLGLGVRPTPRSPARPACRSGSDRRDPGRPADAGGRRCRRRLGGRRLRRDRAPGHRPAGAHPARHARQQAGPGRRHQHRRRVRDLPGRDRHGGDQGLRPRGGPHRAARARGRRRPATRSSRRPSSRPTGPATSPAPTR